MRTSSKTLIDLEKKFWQSMVDQDSDTAVSLNCCSHVRNTSS